MNSTSLRFHFKNLCYGDLEVIKECHFEVTPGEITALLGPSGCGKTTLLNNIAGLNPTRTSTRLPAKDESIGYIFQDARLVPWLTVSENLKLIAPSISDNHITSILNSVELSDVEHNYPNQLSGGMQKRVSIARAFLCTPKLILLDEPFSSLDLPIAQALRQLVKNKIVQEKVATLLVTHDIDEAAELADSIIILTNKPTHVHSEISTITIKNNYKEEIKKIITQAIY